MTVEESKVLRKALESDILILLQKFQSETGLSPAEGSLQRLSDQRLGLPTEERIMQVKVEVTL